MIEINNIVSLGLFYAIDGNCRGQQKQLRWITSLLWQAHSNRNGSLPTSFLCERVCSTSLKRRTKVLFEELVKKPAVTHTISGSCVGTPAVNFFKSGTNVHLELKRWTDTNVWSKVRKRIFKNNVFTMRAPILQQMPFLRDNINRGDKKTLFRAPD